MFEARGRDDLQQARWLIARIPECMWHAAGFDQHGAGPGLDDLLGDLRADNAFQYHAVFILIAVGVDGRAECPRRKRVLQHGQLSGRLVTAQHQDRASGPCSSVIRSGGVTRYWLSLDIIGPLPRVSLECPREPERTVRRAIYRPRASNNLGSSHDPSGHTQLPHVVGLSDPCSGQGTVPAGTTHCVGWPVTCAMKS